MALILGSQSPRRREILNFFALEFTQKNSGFDEDTIPFSGDPYIFAKTLAEEKAKALIHKYPNDTIITADTVVFASNNVLGKPKNHIEAVEMISLLSGKWHEVITGICVAKKGILYSDIETTKVLCNKLRKTRLEHYLEIHHLEDKAGSYAIQKSGGLFVKKIEGCFYNVCGLPINTLQQLLNRVDIDLWDHLQEFDEAL